MHDTVLMVIVCKEETSSIPSPSPTLPVCLLVPVHTPNATPSRLWASHGAASPDKLLGRNICRRISSQNKTTAGTRCVPRPGNYFPSGVFFVGAGSSPVRALPVLCLFIFNKFQKRSFPGSNGGSPVWLSGMFARSQANNATGLGRLVHQGLYSPKA